VEADWEVEIGAEAPVIEPDWSGFVDLRLTPDSAYQLPELAGLPGLARGLIQLNHANSPVWTAKSDVWPVAEFDPVELDAEDSDADDSINSGGPPAYFLACYVDLIARDLIAADLIATKSLGDPISAPAPTQTQTQDEDEHSRRDRTIQWCKTLCQRLHGVPLRSCRVDLIVRRALLRAEVVDFAVTAYITACGPSESDAKRMLESAFLAFAETLFPQQPDSTLE